MDAPTGAARRFNQLDREYSVSLDSRVQTFDLSSMQDSDLWNWWHEHTSPAHSTIADSSRKLLKQLGAKNTDSEVIIADGLGRVKYQHPGEIDDDGYRDLKAAVDETLQNEICPL